MSTVIEKPFEYLKTKKGDSFTEESVQNWHKARAYVLKAFKDNEYAFGTGSDKHLHAVVVGDSPLMLAIVRQLALSAHFINYVEYNIYGELVHLNRSVITLVSQKETDEIVGLLEKEDCLCNLLKYCKHSVFGVVKNQDSYLDVELEIVKDEPKDEAKDEVRLKITEEEVADFAKSQNPDILPEIDTRKAVCASRAYNLGYTINNVPYEGFFLADRYSHALDKFHYRLHDKKNAGELLVKKEWATNQSKVKEGLSNIFCSDCFETRRREIELIWKEDKESIYKAWERTNQALSLSEHSRWLVEKLIMGYRPMNMEERMKYENCFGKVREKYAKELKSNSADPVHIDICSYKDLRRIDPDNMKFDSFLMLAIPWILDKIEADDKKCKD